MTPRALIFAASILVACVGCGGRRGVTVAPDVYVQFAGQERSPHMDPSPRLVAAAGEVRELLGHSLTIEFDAAIAPRDADELEATLIPFFERFARTLVLVQREGDSEAFIAAQRLTHIVVRYVPGATNDESRIRLQDSETIVVSCVTLKKEIDVHDIIALLTRTSGYMDLTDYEPMRPTPAVIKAGASRSWTDFQVLRGARRKRRGDTPQETRVSAIIAVIEKSLGHSLTIAVDPALVPASRQAFLEQSAVALDQLALYLASLQQDPLFHAFVRRRLQRIVVRYRASSGWHMMGFDEATGTLVYDMRWYGYWLPYGWAPGVFNFLTPEIALWPAFIREMHARFRDVDDSKLAVGELALYHKYLQTLNRPLGGAAFLRLEQRTRGTAIHGDVEKTTAMMAAWLSDHPAAAHAVLRRDYAVWIASRLFALEKGVRRGLLCAIFRVGAPYNDSACSAEECVNFPELDRIGLAISILEGLISSATWEFDVKDSPVCSEMENAELSHNAELSYVINCVDIFVFLTSSAEGRERLVAVLSTTKRRELLIAALVKTSRRTGNVMNLFAALEAKGGPLYADALRISMDPRHGIFDYPELALLSEAQSRWAARADLRPLFLGILVEDLVSPRRRKPGSIAQPAEDIAQLAQLEGMDAALFARFLDEGPRSVELAVELLPVLKDVPMPFEIVASRLDAYLALRRPETAHTAYQLVRMACKRGDKEGFRVLRAVLEKRARSGDPRAAALVHETRSCVPGFVSDRRTPVGALETVPAGSA